MRRILFFALVLCFLCVPVLADFDVEATVAPNFQSGLTKVAVVAVQCHESIDCSQVEDAAAEALLKLKPQFAVVHPRQVRQELFNQGATSWSKEAGDAALDKLGVDGVVEITIPFANRGDGFGGHRRSEVRVDLRLVDRKGNLRMSGRGSGRPKNVVSGTERVAGTVIEKIFGKAFP